MELQIDDRLLEWATPRQAEYIEAINRLGSARAAARELDVHHSAICYSVAALKRKATAHGYSPEHKLTKVVPEPFVAKGHSTLYGADGEMKLQWVKSKLDDQTYLEHLKLAADTIVGDIEPFKPVPAPKLSEDAAHFLNQYTITDAHLAMMAWHREGGANYDLKIAEQLFTSATVTMMDQATEARVGLVANLGDYFHSDGLMPMTPTSGHVLDQDSRFGKMIDVGIRVLRRIVEHALRRHERVILLIAEGNHDIASSAWLRRLFLHVLANEPRVTVIDSEKPYYAWQHGTTALFYHHGHLRRTSKPEALALLFASEFPQIWGHTTKRYIHTGHNHSERVIEVSGAKIIQHPTLAARDAHASRHGWDSERQASAITYDDRYGYRTESIITPEMLGIPSS